MKVFDDSAWLDLLWIELTGRCNLACAHCYTSSSPATEDADPLAREEVTALLDEASGLGCRHVQFIGGEPTIVRDLPGYLDHARSLAFEGIEVYTNAVAISDALLERMRANEVEVASSFYCDDPAVHDAITRRPGSQERTLRNFERVIEAGLPLRVGVVVQPRNAHRVRETLDFLRARGIERVSVDDARGVGRGEDVAESSGLDALCGQCWKGRLCITPEGEAYPCIMSRSLPVGSVRRSSLGDIVASAALAASRARIHDEVWSKRGGDGPQACQPNPCAPWTDCHPDAICAPTGCFPGPNLPCPPEQCGPQYPCFPQTCRPSGCPPGGCFPGPH